MSKVKNKHGRTGAPKAKPNKAERAALGAGTKEDLYARLAGAEGQIDALGAEKRRLKTALQEIIDVTLGARTGSGKRAREIADAALDANDNRF